MIPLKKSIIFILFLPLFAFIASIFVVLPLSRAAQTAFAAVKLSNTAAKAAPSGSSSTIACLNTKSGKIEQCNLEEYLIGVVGAEMPALYEPEALKAQAVAARSYIKSRQNCRSADHKDADVCNNPLHCKAHADNDELLAKWQKSKQGEYYNKIKTAVYETRGEYMVYDGEAIEAFFFASSGGRTESSEDVWGGRRGYLKSVESSGDVYSPQLCSNLSVKFEDFLKTLAAIRKAPPAAQIEIGEIKRSEGGSVKTIAINGETYKGSEIRSAFGLKSANFSINVSNGEVLFSVLGSGHGVGMSQYGANYMAKQGKKYTEILSHYYTNIQIVKDE